MAGPEGARSHLGRQVQAAKSSASIPIRTSDRTPPVGGVSVEHSILARRALRVAEAARCSVAQIYKPGVGALRTRKRAHAPEPQTPVASVAPRHLLFPSCWFPPFPAVLFQLPTKDIEGRKPLKQHLVWTGERVIARFREYQLRWTPFFCFFAEEEMHGSTYDVI